MLARSNIPRPYIRHSSQSGLPESNGQSYHPSSQTAFVGAFLKQVLKFEPGSRERRWDIVFHGTPPEKVTSIVQITKRKQGTAHASGAGQIGGTDYIIPHSELTVLTVATATSGRLHQDPGSFRRVDANNDGPVFVCCVLRRKAFLCEEPKRRLY